MANTRTATGTAKTEATKDEITFLWDGDTYTVPTPATTWDLEALEAYEEGHLATCVRRVLGPEQWKTFKAKPRTIGDLNDLFDAAQKAAGFEGN